MKKLVSILLAVTMLLALAVPAAAVSFSDLAGHWGEEYIMKWAEKGVINGYPDGTFQPNKEITRAEVCKVLALAYRLDTDVEPTAFSDVEEGKWYYEYIQACAGAGVVNGYPDGSFAPNAPITRSEAVKMVCIAAGIPEYTTGCEDFSDWDQTPAWAEGYWNALHKEGVIDGYEDGTIRPTRNISRAEMVKILCFVFSELKVYSLSVTIVDSEGKEVSDKTDYLTGDSYLIETLVPMLIANRDNFQANYPSGYARDILDEGTDIAKRGYENGWTEAEIAEWQQFVDDHFDDAEGEASMLEQLKSIDTTINQMRPGVDYVSTTLDYDVDREGIEYTVTITVNVMA